MLLRASLLLLFSLLLPAAESIRIAVSFTDDHANCNIITSIEVGTKPTHHGIPQKKTFKRLGIRSYGSYGHVCSRIPWRICPDSGMSLLDISSRRWMWPHLQSSKDALKVVNGPKQPSMPPRTLRLCISRPATLLLHRLSSMGYAAVEAAGCWYPPPTGAIMSPRPSF